MKTKTKRKSAIALCIVLLALLVSMFGTSMVQSNGGSVKVESFIGTLPQLVTKINNNLKANGRTVDILFTKTDRTGQQLSFTTFIPSTATKEHPAPCIICVHGNNNDKFMQYSNYTEFARRGFVVITVDMSSEGRTDPGINDLTQKTQGTLAATEYAMSLDCVDMNKIGMTGHSGGESTCQTTINVINGGKDSHNHIAAWFCSSGTMAANSMTAPLTSNLIWGVAAGKYDEVDGPFFGSYKFLSSAAAIKLMKLEYPGFNAASIPEGQWYTANGPIAAPTEGQAINAKSAVVFYNPAYTHPMGTWTTEASRLAINFFYTAFGTPAGATYLSSTNQIWVIGAIFQGLGLIAFFALMLPLVSVLLETPAFASLKRSVPTRKELPSIKSWKEWLPMVLTFIPLILFPYLTYFTYYSVGNYLFDSTSFPMGTINGFAWWTLCGGLFAILMLFVNWGLKKLVHIKDKTPVESPFAPGKLDNAKHFWKTLGFVALIVIIMYIPAYIAYNVFNCDFRVSVYAVNLPRFQWLPDMILKYLPFWLVYMIPNAILNADTKFNELPEWASTTICALANFLPIGVLTLINYTTLFSTGTLWNSSSQPGICAFNFFAPMIFIAISGRYIYNRTKNAWAAGMLNATIVTIMAGTATMHNTSVMFHL